MTKFPVYIGLGGNMGNPYTTLQSAVSQLSTLPKTQLSTVSRFYTTSPVGPIPQAPFINAVCCIVTELEPFELYLEMQRIETNLGKVPKHKDAPRPVDLDLLFYGADSYCKHGLEIPHPRWKQRLFVLIPLADITPTILINTPNGPQQFVIQDLINSISDRTQHVSLLEKNSHP